MIDEDNVNYRKIAMFLAFPSCTFKCDRECGRKVCQNSSLAKEPGIEVSIISIIERYLDNPISKALVIGGLEPLDSPRELYFLMIHLREYTNDDIVIYTGYTEEEPPVQRLYAIMKQYQIDNVYIKFGRFIPDCKSHYDDVLGVRLASPNQYGKKVELHYDRTTESTENYGLRQQ
jgi:hypothetical protein